MNASVHTPPAELHLPDLPELQVTLGGLLATGRPDGPAGSRWRDLIAGYLPLLLMALLAAATWWLVKHTLQPEAESRERLKSSGPDYTMNGFSITRFDSQGRYRLHIEGDVLRHFPDTDRIEIEGVRIHAQSPEGRATRASARRALANGDASEVQLLGGAHMLSETPGAASLEIEGEFLHAFLRTERLHSHLPVIVRRAGSVTQAAGIDYDHLTRRLQLAGPVRASFLPPAGSRMLGKPP